jgi:hypothetical protein
LSIKKPERSLIISNMHPQNQCPFLRGIGLVGIELGLACAVASAVTGLNWL